MNRRTLILILLLSAACIGLGVSFGAQVFGCNQDEFGADHTFFKASDCFQSRGTDGSVFLECRRVVTVGGAK
jgi:hypothetical protein